MREYCIYYWTEMNDENTDVERYIKAKDIHEALAKFMSYNISHKYIESISLVY